MRFVRAYAPPLNDVEYCGTNGPLGWSSDPFVGFPGGATYSWTYNSVNQPSYTSWSIPFLGAGTYLVELMNEEEHHALKLIKK